MTNLLAPWDRMRSLLAVVPLIVAATALAPFPRAGTGLAAQAERPQPFDFYARGPYRDAVPRPAGLLGYEPGEFHTTYGRMERVVDSIARSASDRVRVFEYGMSEERRRLRLIAVSAPENIARLEEIRAQLDELADPRKTPPARAAAIAAQAPAIVWLNYANDGDESAAFEAAMQVLYQLAASEETATLESLRRAVVLINPAHNPESHERFVAWYNAFGTGDPTHAALEHDAPWGMASNNNHYQIDLNRDALGMTQRETRALVAAVHRWRPQVFVDHHGQTEQMFFPPAALPVNPALPRRTRDWLERFGRGNAEAFDRHGWQYYVGEIFDLYYPGYWDSWPALNGAIGMTYETDGGGELGLNWRRDDGSIATLRGGIARHFTASVATVETAARHRQELLRDYYEFRASGMADARGAGARLKRVVIPPGRDPRRVMELAEILVRNEIEVRRAGGTFVASPAHDYARPEAPPARRTFPAGTLVVDLAQPQARLAATLLDPQPALDPEFVRLELDKRARNARRGTDATREGDAFYDVTGWALPLLFGVEAYWTEDGSPVAGPLVTLADTLVPVSPPARARSAYLFPNDRNGAAVLALRLAAEGFRVAVARRPLGAAGRTFPRGTWVVRTERNSDAVHERIAQLARELSVEVTVAMTAFPDTGGAGVGSEEVVPVHRPRIAMLAGEGTSETGYGALWFLLERRFGVPFTPFRASAIDRLPLDDYNVLILPHGGGMGGGARALRSLLAGEVLGRLKRWIDGGGVLIAIKGAAVIVADTATGLTSVRPVGTTDEPKDPKGAARFKPDTAPLPPSARPGPPLPSPTADEGREPLAVPGVIARATLDGSHWLTYGYEGGELPVLLWTDRFLAPSREGENPVAFTGTNVIVSGFEWPDNSERLLAGSVYAAVERRGRGNVVLFADDPAFRAITQGTWRLLANAILMGTGR